MSKNKLINDTKLAELYFSLSNTKIKSFRELFLKQKKDNKLDEALLKSAFEKYVQEVENEFKQVFGGR